MKIRDHVHVGAGTAFEAVTIGNNVEIGMNRVMARSFLVTFFLPLCTVRVVSVFSTCFTGRVEKLELKPVPSHIGTDT